MISKLQENYRKDIVALIQDYNGTFQNLKKEKRWEEVNSYYKSKIKRKEKGEIISLSEKYPKLFFKLRDIYKQKNIDDLKQVIEWSEQFIKWIKKGEIK